MKQIELQKDILNHNNLIGYENSDLFARKGIFVLNLMSSPGAGKTTLLERTIELLKNKYHIGVIEGDIATTFDAERIGAHGVEVTQINTGGACHLDSSMISKVLADFDLDHTDMLIIENVGNLVCPAEFFLGEDAKAVILSVTEGADKPLKYPLIFRLAKALIINKIDLLPYIDCSVPGIIRDATGINHALAVFRISCTSGQGLDAWNAWLEGEIHKKKKTRLNP
jgi:hydrogenase nickel incorporation protein HypB